MGLSGLYRGFNVGRIPFSRAVFETPPATQKAQTGPDDIRASYSKAPCSYMVYTQALRCRHRNPLKAFIEAMYLVT